ncbi:hypothetical protein FCJ61_11490 [Burkholderia metallica]|uniref:hypothetical protein n=1 Tax=Burkholderia metallica TaxID=488729 RepID=UPI00157B42AC|nr:hypothetical protein [Burkholderia metallica]NTZ83607.1 hypothetical protein [Burkholderia metallica]
MEAIDRIIEAQRIGVFSCIHMVLPARHLSKRRMSGVRWADRYRCRFADKPLEPGRCVCETGLGAIVATQSTSEARTDAGPRVATLDNVEAVMDDKSRFFVRVQGYTAGDLYTVAWSVSTVGWRFYLSPSVVCNCWIALIRIMKRIGPRERVDEYSRDI